MESEKSGKRGDLLAQEGQRKEVALPRERTIRANPRERDVPGSHVPALLALSCDG